MSFTNRLQSRYNRWFYFYLHGDICSEDLNIYLKCSYFCLKRLIVFSSKHSLHIKFRLSFFSCQIYFESSVSYWYFVLLRDFRWLRYRVLKLLAVIPMYVVVMFLSTYNITISVTYIFIFTYISLLKTFFHSKINFISWRHHVISTLHIMVIGLSGVQFGLYSYWVTNKIGRPRNGVWFVNHE